MLNIRSPEVKQRIAGWEKELRSMTNDHSIFLVATKFPDWRIDLAELGEIIVHVTGVSLQDIKSGVRKRSFVIARQLLCYYSRKVTSSGLKEVGIFLGNRDHTTVLHSDATIKDFIQVKDPNVMKYVERINFYLEELRKRKPN
jgi:chromosomal replication initiation ATPase DnaA